MYVPSSMHVPLLFHACFLSFHAKNNHANKGNNNRHKEYFFSVHSLRASDTSFTDPKRISEGLSNDISIGVTCRAASKNLLPAEASIHSAYQKLLYLNDNRIECVCAR